MPWLATRARSAPTMTARRDTRSATTPPIRTLADSGRYAQASTSHHGRRRSAHLEHREGERDRDHPVAEYGDGLPGEEQPEVAPAEDGAAL